MTARYRGTGSLATLLCAAAVVLAPSAALAQSGGSHQSSPSQTSASGEISDQVVETFAEARSEVLEISKQWTEKLQQADSAEEQERMRQQAQQEMVTAVQSSGMSVEEYNQVARAMQDDPALEKRIEDAR
jgi:hypothetical protein